MSADVLNQSIDQLRRDYVEGIRTRDEAHSAILDLVPAHGPDAVMAALPPPWRRTFYDWAQRTFDNDTPLESFVAVGRAVPAAAIERIRPWLAAHRTPPADPEPTVEVRRHLAGAAVSANVVGLDTELLFGLAIQQSNPSIAQVALGELARNGGFHARDAAESILMSPVWDRQLAVDAMRALYRLDRRRALELMEPLIVSDDPLIVDCLVAIVLGAIKQFQKGTGSRFAKELAAHVMAAPPGDFSGSARRLELVHLFGTPEQREAVATLDNELIAIARDYYETNRNRSDACVRMSALISTSGPDTVFSHLWPPWRGVLYEWMSESVKQGRLPAEASALVKPWLEQHRLPPEDPIPTPAVDEYFIEAADEIDFSKIESRTVFQLAIQRVEPSIATSALGELARRRVFWARDAAEAILVRPVWDRYLTAHAMTILYGSDPDRALVLMTAFLASDDPVLVDEMVEIVWENPADFADGERRAFAKHLAVRVAAAPPGEHTDRARRAELLQQYGAPES